MVLRRCGAYVPDFGVLPSMSKASPAVAVTVVRLMLLGPDQVPSSFCCAASHFSPARTLSVTSGAGSGLGGAAGASSASERTAEFMAGHRGARVVTTKDARRPSDQRENAGR